MTGRTVRALYCPDCRRPAPDGECPVHPAIVLEPPGPDDDGHDPTADLPDPWAMCGGPVRAA